MPSFSMISITLLCNKTVFGVVFLRLFRLVCYMAVGSTLHCRQLMLEMYELKSVSLTLKAGILVMQQNTHIETIS